LELRANKTAARLLVPLQPMTQKISRLSAPFWPSPKNAVLFFDGTCDVCMDLHGKHCFFFETSWNITIDVSKNGTTMIICLKHPILNDDSSEKGDCSLGKGDFSINHGGHGNHARYA